MATNSGEGPLAYLRVRVTRAYDRHGLATVRAVAPGWKGDPMVLKPFTVPLTAVYGDVGQPLVHADDGD